jgi:hypothetical protein
MIENKIVLTKIQDQKWLEPLPNKFTCKEAGAIWGMKAVSANWRLMLLRCSGLVDYRRNGTASGEWRKLREN